MLINWFQMWTLIAMNGKNSIKLTLIKWFQIRTLTAMNWREFDKQRKIIGSVLPRNVMRGTSVPVPESIVRQCHKNKGQLMKTLRNRYNCLGTMSLVGNFENV